VDYKELAKEIRDFRKSAKNNLTHKYSYEEWYDFRICLSHQMATRADEKWFANQINGSTDGTGKQWWEKFNREVDIGDGFCGDTLEPGVNNYDLKVTFLERNVIEKIGFQQYRPADPIAFYAAFMGTGPKDYTLIIVPKDVALRMKLDKILKTGKLGSAHGTGLYDKMTTEEKMNVITEASATGKSCVVSFDVQKKSSKQDFELLMDSYRMPLDSVSEFITSHRERINKI
jgi:hypothetical protein